MKKNTILNASVNATDWVKVKAMTDEEIVYDEDSPLTTVSDWDDAVVSHSRKELKEQLAKRGVGRPVEQNPKRATTLRLSPDVMDAFRSTGKGWQTRIDEALKDWLKTHPQH